MPAVAVRPGEAVERSEPCQICRARKVKCDRRAGGCANCERLGFSCVYSDGSGPGNHDSHSAAEGQLPQSSDPLNEYTLAGTQRKRTRRACRLCYLQKARCTGEPVCARCRSQGRECVYPPRTAFKHLSRTSAQFSGNEPQFGHRDAVPQVQRASDPPLIQGLDVEDDEHQSSGAVTAGRGKNGSDIPMTIGLEKHVISQYIDAFFDLIQPNLCFFLHRATFISKWNTGTLDECQLKAVCGCAAHFVASSSSSDSPAEDFMTQVETQVLKNIGAITLLQLQNTFLLVYYKYVLHQLGSVWMLFSLCVRSAYAQGLNHENPSLPVLERESRRRLMWSIYLLDKLISGSLPDLTICTSKSIHLRLPCNERCFSYGIESKTQYLDYNTDDASPQDMGVLAYLLRLIHLRLRIHSCIKPIIAEGTSPWYCKEELASLERELIDFENFLPLEFKWNTENLALRAYTPSLTSYVMLHSWWYSTQCDLYRCFIPGIRESVSEEAVRATPPEYMYSFRQKILQSSIGHTKLWKMVHELHIPRPVNDQNLGIHVYHCAQVMFFLKDLIVQQSGGSAESGFELLKPWLAIVEELCGVYPMLKDINKDISGNFLGRNQDQSQRDASDLRLQQSPEKSLRARLLSKYTMVPSLSDDIAYSSRQENEATVSPTAQRDIDQMAMTTFDEMEVLNPPMTSHSENLSSTHIDEALHGLPTGPPQEWSSSLLGDPTVIGHEIIQPQDLSWIEGPDLMFFPGFYHGQLDQNTNPFST